MPDAREPLAVFDDDILEATASESDFARAAVATLVERHQNAVRELPGVEDIVYEWRTQFHRDPLRDRTPERYVLELRESVWSEFAESLDLTADELATLQSVHRKQAERVLADLDTSNGSPMVLTRP